MKHTAIFLIRCYQKVISPILPQCCRYTPTCSQYMIEAIGKKGLFRGLYMGTLRILRCNPYFPGGHDPVP